MSSKEGHGMANIEKNLETLRGLKTCELRAKWRHIYGVEAPRGISHDLLIRSAAYHIQEDANGGLDRRTKQRLRSLAKTLETEGNVSFEPGVSLKPGTKLVREWGGRIHCVISTENGFDYEGRWYRSLSKIAREITGTHWSGPRFFGLTQGLKLNTNGEET